MTKQKNDGTSRFKSLQHRKGQTAHMTSDEKLSIIRRTVETLGVIPSETQCQMLSQYAEQVLHWNERVNLTGARDINEFIRGPLFDALTLIPVFEPCKNFVDIGSGGGLPAVPLAILYADAHITMVEPRGKRAEFLKKAVNNLHLNATVFQTQDRELAQRNFDGASAQAVFPPKKWLARAKQLVRTGGAIYTLTAEEINDSMLPNRVHIETQQKFIRNGMARYAARLRKMVD